MKIPARAQREILDASFAGKTLRQIYRDLGGKYPNSWIKAVLKPKEVQLRLF